MIVVAIKSKFDIKLSDTSLGRLLLQLRLSCQKPFFRALQQTPNPIFLNRDGDPTQKTKKARQRIDPFDGKLKIYTLPSYSPRLNPVEQVWNNVTNHGIGRKKVFGPDQMKALVIGQLRRLQKPSSIVTSFFRHPYCFYTWCGFL